MEDDTQIVSWLRHRLVECQGSITRASESVGLTRELYLSLLSGGKARRASYALARECRIAFEARRTNGI